MFNITILELMLVIKRKWKTVCVFMLAFMLLCGGYKLLSDLSDQKQIQPDANYEEEMKTYGEFQSSREEIPGTLQSEWERIYHDRTDNPIFSLNPYQCEYEQIVLRFDNKGSNYDWTVKNWISKADNHELFGEQEETLSSYKYALVSIGRTLSEQTSFSNETAVQVLSIDGFDAKIAADYLMKHFKKCAADDNLNIEGISRARIQGYNENVGTYQDKSRARMTSIYLSIEDTNNIDRYVAAPVTPQDTGVSSIRHAVKYGIIGLVLGFIIGAAIVSFGTVRRREILSTRQIEDTFHLSLLSDCSSGDELCIDVLNANLDLMTDKKGSFMVVADQSINGIEDIPSKWAKESGNSFIVATDSFDNPETIEALKTTDGIILGIRIGKSRIDQVQKVLQRVQTLKQRVLGYVLL